jgi:hypothetical protein
MHGTLEQQVGDEHIRVARIVLRNGTEISLRDVTVRSDSVIAFVAIALAGLGPNYTAVPSPAPSAR